MVPNLNRNDIEKTFKQALEKGLVRSEDTAVMFHDLGYLEQRIRHLIGLFPETTLHALAVKANPLMKIMEFTRGISPQVGVEAASIGEVQLALRAGYEPHRIVYDSPVKTSEELEFALVTGIHLNIDNLSELARVEKLLERITTRSVIGIRINPQVGAGTIAESSVAGEYSKFGVPIGTRRNEIIDAFRNHPWLTGVHLHVGSQGCSPEMLVEGAGVLYDLMQDAGYRLKQFDIGGGFPISYHSTIEPPRIDDYVAALRSRCPLLFTAHCSLLTEFGRWVYTNAGWTASRVEYVKRDPGINTAMIHTGADLFVRECLNPTDWQHEYIVADRNGHLKSGQSEHPWNLAGPLCFSGDILAKNLILPEIEEGDYIIIRDTGGYTFSMWSRYNSRFAPRILGYANGSCSVLKEREDVGDLLAFWGG
jgi:diaminopimelate decarboxylase